MGVEPFFLSPHPTRQRGADTSVRPFLIRTPLHTRTPAGRKPRIPSPQTHQCTTCAAVITSTLDRKFASGSESYLRIRVGLRTFPHRQIFCASMPD